MAARGAGAVVGAVRRIGVLVGSAEDESYIKERLAGFRQRLEKLGWSDGRNVRIDPGFAAGRADQFQMLAKELVACSLT
jgi:putative ABC transport system substrate-binding protein